MMWVGIAIYAVAMLFWMIYEMRHAVEMPDELEEQTPQFEEENTNLKNQNHDQSRSECCGHCDAGRTTEAESAG